MQSLAHTILPTLLTLTIIGGSATEAQAYFSYHVEVYHYQPFGDYGYWSSEYETTDYSQALLMRDLFEAALDSNELSEILGIQHPWYAWEVRIRSEFNYPTLQYQRRAIFQNYEPIWFRQ